MGKIITKKEARERAREILDNLDMESMCFENNGLHWQVNTPGPIELCVEGYSEQKKCKYTIADIADSIYEFLNR